MKSILRTMLTITLSWFVVTPTMAADDLEYVAVNPCRLVDTRNAGGAIPANTFRNFRVSGTAGELAVQGGTTNCLDPKAGTGLKPSAIVAYVLAVPAPGSTNGVLSAYPSNLLPPPTGSGSTVNFGSGQVIGNTTTITLCNQINCPTDGELAILTRATSQHVIIDVQGYFYPAEVNVETVRVSTSSNAGLSFASVSEVVLVTCPTGSIITGSTVSCDSSNFDSSTTNWGVVAYHEPVIGPNDPGGAVGYCAADGVGYSASKLGPPVTVYAVCLQAASASVATIQSTVANTTTNNQGQPSQEALLLLESLRNEVAARASLVNSAN